MSDLTDLLQKVQGGSPGAREALFAAAYPELRQLARSRLRRDGGHTLLQTTLLVHETYLRYVRAGQLRADNRRAFFAYAGQVMRSVVVDLVREHQAERRGGDISLVTLDHRLTGEGPAAEPGAAEVLAVHEAVDRLGAIEPRLAQVVEMRYFGGYSDAEIAEALDLNERTVRRDWEKARLMLLAMLS